MAQIQRRKERYYRHLSNKVLQMYYELESGSVPGGEFDVRVLNYRLDVERLFRTLSQSDQSLLTAVYRDGLTATEAVRAQSVGPLLSVARAEVSLGRLLDQHQLLNVEAYLNP